MKRYTSKSQKVRAHNGLTERHLESLEQCFDNVAIALMSPYEVSKSQARAWRTIAGRIKGLKGTKSLIKRISKAMKAKITVRHTELTAFRDLMHRVSYNTL